VGASGPGLARIAGTVALGLTYFADSQALDLLALALAEAGTLIGVIRHL
jgi:hypothetical protein